MPLLQKWLLGLTLLGAGFLVFQYPGSFYKVASGLRSLTAGSIVDVTTGGRGKSKA